jgi:hypothetical protein
MDYSKSPVGQTPPKYSRPIESTDFSKKLAEFAKASGQPTVPLANGDVAARQSNDQDIGDGGGQDKWKNYNITQHENGGCTSGLWQWRVMVPVAIMDMVFDLRHAALMEIPFPRPMFTAECFEHPIWEHLTTEQQMRINEFGMSFDPLGCNYDNDHCDFFESELKKLKDPHYCSFYVETGLDPFENLDGLDLERTYDDNPPHRFVKYNTYDIKCLIKMFLDPDEAGSVIVYEHRSTGTIQYDIVNFVYDMERVLTDDQLDLANAILDAVRSGKYPDAIKDVSRSEAFYALATAMVADDSGMVSWDTALYLMQFICESMPKRLWLAKKLCRRIFGSDNNTVQFEREENYEWFARNADCELKEIIRELRNARRWPF